MPKAGFRKCALNGMPDWHARPNFIDPDTRHELYEARLALDWCRLNGNPHLKKVAPKDPS